MDEKTFIEFHKLTSVDCQQLHLWLQEPHVMEFWDDGNRTIEQTQAYYYQQNGVKRFIFSIENIPAGYIQMYDLNLNDTYQQLFSDNKKTVGIDFFIGNEQFVGKGLAALILQKFIQTHCGNAERTIVDPNSKNSRAIHVYKKMGFKKIISLLIKNELLDIMIYAI